MQQKFMINRAALKQEAKSAMSATHPHPCVVTLAMFGIFILVGVALGIISGILSKFDMFGAMLSALVSLAVSLCSFCIEVGFLGYCYKVYIGRAIGVADLFAYAPQVLKYIGLALFVSLFTWLWSLLFVIPGVIASLRYSQALFVMIEHPEMGIRECVNESKRIMKGRLMEYFVLDLSFIPWGLLTSITFGIAGIYVMPYMIVTMAGYYLKIRD